MRILRHKTLWAPLMYPAASRAFRMAATLPSIISEGATISAPACAWLTAVFASKGRGLVIQDGTVGAQHAAMAMGHIFAKTDIGDYKAVSGHSSEHSYSLLEQCRFPPRLTWPARPCAPEAQKAGWSSVRFQCLWQPFFKLREG